MTARAWLVPGAQGAAALTLLLTVRIASPGSAYPWELSALAGVLAAALLFRVLAGGWPVLAPWRRDRALALILTIAFLAGTSTGEEVLWRWLALGGLRPLAGTVLAYGLSTIGFALSHASGTGAKGVLVHLLTGGTFGGLYLATGSLAAVAVAHASYNVMIVLALESRRSAHPAEPG